jgi:hypothetical protein
MTMVAGALLLVSALGAWAQLQNGDQQLCINKLNKGAALLAKTQGAENVNCVKLAGKGTLIGSAQACLTADAKGKVAQRGTKMTADENAKCVGSPPDYAYTSAAIMIAAAKDAEVDLVADVYGPNLDAAIITCASSKTGCACQEKVSKAVEAVAFVKFFEFVKCKKAVLKAGATTEAAVAKCVNDAATAGSIAADSSDKVAKSVDKLEDTIVKKCDTPGVTAGAFPGTCTGLNGSALGDCLDTQVECRVCQAINEMDDFFVNCDLFDDSILNGSCLSGSQPTPTPTATATPTPTITATPTPTTTATPGLFVGALSRTIGHWRYNATVGIAGGIAACQSTFNPSHLCTVSELQASQGALLTGATDVDAIAIDHFWAVDPAATDLHQCISAIPNPITRWAYATAHTASKGDFLELNNGAGTLGSLNNGGLPVVCTMTNMFSVGCCR